MGRLLSLFSHSLPITESTVGAWDGTFGMIGNSYLPADAGYLGTAADH